MLGEAAVRALPVEGRSYGLSPLQSGLLFEALLHAATPGDAGWNVEQVHGVLSEALELGPFRAAWTLVARRHPVLSSAFRWEGVPAPVRVVHEQVRVPVESTDHSRLSAESAAERVASFLELDRQRGFDLRRFPLMRVTVFARPDGNSEFVWTFHHALLDGRTFAPILREVFTAYEALRKGQAPELPPPPRPYEDFIEWLGTVSTRPSLDYFRTLLSGKRAPTPLPGAESAQRPLARRGYGEATSVLDPVVVESARALARTTSTTLGTVVQAAWALVLARFTHDRDVVFGSTRACRRSALDGDTASMIGLFINTLPVRANVASERTVRDLLEHLRTQSLALRQHEHAQLVDIRGVSEMPAGTPLFETLVMFETHELNQSLRAAGPEWKGRRFSVHEQPSIPLNLTVFDGERFEVRLLFDRKRYSRATIERLSQAFANAVEGLAADPDRPLARVNVLSASETERIVHAWNLTDHAFPDDLCIHEGFEARVDLAPDAPALEMDGVSLTYRELEERANRLAHCLRERGVGPGTFVGICLTRGFELVAAALAVAKSGAAYVPLDPAWPVARLTSMTRIAQAALILTEREHSCRFELPTLVLDGADAAAVREAPATRLQRATTPTDPCYTIFTSGSTGQPKGVVLTHRAVVNTLDWVSRTFEVAPGDRLLFVTSFCFDLSVYDLFGVLAAGATMVVASERLLGDPELLARSLNERAITIWDSAPAALQRLVPFLPSGLGATTLRLVMLSGDWIPLALPDTVRRAFPGVQVKSLGGATECAIWSNWFDVGQLDPRWTSVPYGRPIQNCRYHVLDDELRPVPVGVAGDLYIGGACLASGYQSAPALTAERFIADPFRPGERLYKTGDLARYFESGDLEFLGRADSQVKIRGFRVEMGEVELAIAALPGVLDVVCNAHVDGAGQRALAAYVVPRAGASLEPAEIKRQLRAELPDFAIPAQVQLLPALPLSSNGKVDRKALPSPLERARHGGGVAPRSVTERKLVEVWESVLKQSPIGVTESFFDLGGHSMLAVLLMSEIKKQLGRDVPLSRVLASPTIELFARSLDDEAPPPTAEMASTEPRGLIDALRAGGEHALFLVHDGDGETLLYRSFAQALPPGIAVFGIRPRSLPGIPMADLSVEAMAARYLDELRRLRPTGPYYLGGLCAGGVVAFEMASQLEQSGERAELVMLLEAVPPTTRRKPFLETSRRLRDLRNLWSRGRGTPQDSATTSSAATAVDPWLGTARKLRRYVEYVVASNVTALGTAGRLQLLRHVLERGARWPAYVPSLTVRDVYEGARGRHEPKLVHAPRVVLVKASSPHSGKGDTPLSEMYADPMLGWDRYVSGSIDTIEVQGGHTSMLQEPWVASLARALEQYLPGGPRYGGTMGSRNPA